MMFNDHFRPAVSTMVALCFVASLLSGCGNSSERALHGEYIAPLPDGTSASLTFGGSGCDMAMSGTYDPKTNAIGTSAVSTGMSYTLVGTTVRVSGGQITPAGRLWMLLHGLDPDGQKDGDVVLLTVGDNGQSLSQTTSKGSLVYIRQ